LWTVGQVFGARLVAQAAGFVIAVLIARVLGPHGFGVYSFMLIAATLLAQVPGPGLDMSAVRVSARSRATDPERSRLALRVAGAAKAVLGAILAITVVVAASALPVQWLGQAENAGALRIAGPAALALALTEFVLATLQAYERFGRLLVVTCLAAALKFGAVAVLWAQGALTLPNAMLAFAFTAGAGLLVSAVVSWRLWAGSLRNAGALVAELWAFSRWFVLATLFGALSSNLDVLAVSHMAGAAATGIYAAGRTLTLPLAFAGGALGAVLLPRLSRIEEPAELRRQVRQLTLLAACGAALAVAVISTLAAPFINRIYGAGYVAAIPVLQVLALAYGIQLATWPALTALIVLDRPDLAACLSLVMVLSTGAGYALSVPLWGALGAAWVFCGGTACLLLAYLVIARKEFARCTARPPLNRR
jgi:O-antigen/teichoic acid export membrane protein